MTDISRAGRIIANQVISSADTFGSGLASSIAAKGSDVWGSGPLWAAEILSMRTHGGGLAQNLENLRTIGGDVFEQLPAHLRDDLDNQLTRIKAVMDEIHTDAGGSFVTDLENFKTYGNDVSAALQELMEKADTEAARITIGGTQQLNVTVTGDAPVQAAAQATQELKTMAAGSS